MVNEDGTIDKSTTINGQVYEVVASTANGRIWQTKDKIRNTTTGVEKELTRFEWKKIFNKYKQ